MIKISIGNSRHETRWKNTEIEWDALKRRVSQTMYTTETVEEYRKMSKGKQADIKDKGGFVGGHLKNGRRKKGNVLCRSFLALDMDYGTPGIWEEKLSKLPYMLCVYSTHKHTAKRPRLRILIPLKREISEAEYGAVSRQVAREIGIDLFDDSTYQAQRLMYWPTTSKDGEFYFREKGGEQLDPDTYLAMYDDWEDMTTWPVSSRQSAVHEPKKEKVDDPLTKPGLIGIFCRAYSMTEALDAFMNDVYEPSAVPNRYDYKPAESSAGVVVYDDKYMYSHHATDPLCGRLLNAFDMVRLHKFSGLDEKSDDATPVNQLPSYKAMVEFARNDAKVKTELINAKQQEASIDFKGSDWESRLEITSKGDIVPSVGNYNLILANDPNLRNIAYNELKSGVDTIGEVPWPQIRPGWCDLDYSCLAVYISQHYSIYSPQKMKDALVNMALIRKFHPIRDYLNALSPWDEVPRVDTLLVDYLGAKDTPYTRAVTRKTLVAAIARVFRPGIKFDSVLILNGPQGIGKSTIFAKLGGKWFSDSLTITDMRDKSGAEKLQDRWILELGELAGMRKMDMETVKSFITSTNDVYRQSYARTADPHLRQCILVGTTNAENGFLRDVTGNRRYWPVPVSGNSPKKPWELTKDDVDMLWAEALHLYKDGENLYLETKFLSEAKAQQKEAMESDEREGLVAKYLDTLLPENWSEMDTSSRRIFLSGGDMVSSMPPATVVRKKVSNMEIYVECFGGDMHKMSRKDSNEIASIMSKMPGWSKTNERCLLKIYGRQRVYVRDE